MATHQVFEKIGEPETQPSLDRDGRVPGWWKSPYIWNRGTKTSFSNSKLDSPISCAVFSVCTYWIQWLSSYSKWKSWIFYVRDRFSAHTVVDGSWFSPNASLCKERQKEAGKDFKSKMKSRFPGVLVSSSVGIHRKLRLTGAQQCPMVSHVCENGWGWLEGCGWFWRWYRFSGRNRTFEYLDDMRTISYQSDVCAESGSSEDDRSEDLGNESEKHEQKTDDGNHDSKPGYLQLFSERLL